MVLTSDRTPKPDPVQTVKPVNKSRINVIEQIYHSMPQESPTSIEMREGWWIGVDQPYSRITTVGEQWKRLEAGWVENCCLMVVVNKEGKSATIPTPEEKTAMEARIIEIGSMCGETYVVTAIIPPERSARFQPYNLKNLYVRCRSGSAKYVCHFYPE